jgi:hypothetical protein
MDRSVASAALCEPREQIARILAMRSQRTSVPEFDVLIQFRFR